MRAIPTLKISISGVRGVVGESLTPTLLTRFAQAFGTYVGSGTIVIGRDTRTTGEMSSEIIAAETDPFVAQLRDLAEAIEQGREPYVPLRQGAATLRLALAAVQSGREHRELRLADRF